MQNSFLVAARTLAWIVAVGAVIVVAASYRSLPDSIPLTQWTYAPKSLLLVVRVPLINVLTVGLVELLARSVARAPVRGAAAAIVALFLTAAAKSGIEAAGLLLLPRPIAWTLWPLGAVLVVGLGTATFFAREYFEPERWRQLRLTRHEAIVAALLASGIAALNLPLALP